MRGLYSSPLRLYLIIGILALFGLWQGLHLPISLFPNATRPVIFVSAGYGSMISEEYRDTYGTLLESQLRAIAADKAQAQQVNATYKREMLSIDITFRWGDDPEAALREVQTIVNALTARLPQESRNSTWTYLSKENSGFFAATFYSPTRDLPSLYQILNTTLTPRLSRVKDADVPTLWNPSSQEVRLELDLAAMATLGLLPRDIDAAVRRGFESGGSGSIAVGQKTIPIEMPRSAQAIKDLEALPLISAGGKMVRLSEVARINFGPKTTDNNIVKTSGSSSIILFASPKPGGNIKQMSEDILEAIKATMVGLPHDITYKVLVDPAEFIRSAIANVIKEVLLGALLAVGILFLFIGSMRNVITAAIEIPISMVLAFILMRLFGMNLNLISLGGLALSSGMNVDASVVVMENIFRHFAEHHKKPMNAEERLALVVQAVKEVRFPVIASTIASLVVFLPLAFTSNLSYAVLGDLAKAVVFSHGFSAIVALILVPTIRLHLMQQGSFSPKDHLAPIDGLLRRLENGYVWALRAFLQHKRLTLASYTVLIVSLAALAFLALTKLPKEIIGAPDTDWIYIGLSTKGNTMTKQMEIRSDEMERELLEKFGDKILYTFDQISVNYTSIMTRLKDKSQMQTLIKAFEKNFAGNPEMRADLFPWNPSELPIPDPPHLKIAVEGPSVRDNADTAQQLADLLTENQVFPHVWTRPGGAREQGYFISPYWDQWALLGKDGARLMPSDLMDIIRVGTQGTFIRDFTLDNLAVPIMMNYKNSAFGSIQDLAALPIAIGGKIVPLKALARVEEREYPPTVYRDHGRSVYFVYGKANIGEGSAAPAALAKAKALVAAWQNEHVSGSASGTTSTVTFEEPDKDVSDALRQIGFAVAWSVLLIFLTMVVQFGGVIEPLLVMVSVPLGFIGALGALFLFKSSLSLNSALGIILLNGIAVANSIMLVDYMKRLYLAGQSPWDAALNAGKRRLRPILITSLTTVLAMMPIALGYGEGGRILQPLGIAVAGGLWISTFLTLFIVPTLYASTLTWTQRDTSSGNLRP